ncbi:MAG: N-6 DNA methylase [Prevotella sp.]|nr:N-6 DNA methylase [Prevotella sp.]
MKNFENSLDSFMKLFPNTYLPLLIMYLSREGLLKVESDVDENDSRVLFRITAEEIVDFFGITVQAVKESKTIIDLIAPILGIDFSNKAWLEKYDSDCWLPCAQMVKRTIDNPSLPYAMVFECVNNKDFDKVKEILYANSSQPDEPAAFWLLCEMLLNAFPAISENDYRTGFHYTRLFDSFIDRQQRFSNNFYMQPTELTRIILSQYEGGSVYNPFAGIASYHVEMAHGLRKDVGEEWCDFYNNDSYFNAENSLGEYYYGEEIDELTWAIGKLRLMFYHMDSPNYILGDSTKEFDGSVNNILCTPSFNLQIVNEKGEKEYTDHFVLRRGVKMLADDGMMAVVVPTSFFKRRDTFDLRKDLVCKHLISHIVYLPENIFPTTRISTAIIFVEKGSKNNRVKFVDATKMVIGRSLLNVAAISNLIEHNDYPKGDNEFTFGELGECSELTPTIFNTCICFETYGNIGENDYDLSPSNYFSSYITIPEGYKLERLDKLISLREPMNIGFEIEGKYIASSDLVKDYQLPYIDYASLGSKTVNSNYKRLEKKSLLVSAINELRPSLFVPKEGKDAYISPNVLAFYLNDKKVNAEYLIGELSKDYIKEQLRIKAMGSTLHRIKQYDILSLQILVPDGKDFLQKEKGIAENQKTTYLEKMGVDLAELRDKRHDEYIKMLRQRKHRIQQVMNEFGPALALLDRRRVENGGVLHDSDVVASRTGETVDSYFNKLRVIEEKVEDLITNLVEKDHWEQTEQISIDDYVNEIPKQHVSDKYQFQVYINRDIEIYEEGEVDLNNDRFVKVNKNDLATVFDNIIANAAKWGFTENVRRDYVIRIEVSDGYVDNHQAVIINISNNGTPIHPSVDRKRFFDWGYGSGTGIGTWQLKDIVEHYGGTIKLNEYLKDPVGFCTEYEIVLPLIDND